MAREDRPLQLNPRFTHLVESRGSVVLVGEDDSFLIEQRETVRLVEALDGRRNAVEISNALAGRIPQEMTHYLILLLQEEGIITPADRPDHSGPPSTESPDPHAANVLSQSWASRQKRSAVLCSRLVRGAQVLLADDYLSPEIVEVIDSAEVESILLVRLGIEDIWIGPTLSPGSTACVSCLQHRLRINLSARALVHAPSPARDVVVLHLPRSIPFETFELAAAALGRVQSRTTASPVHRLIVVRADGSEDRHRVERLPQCDRCGDPRLTAPGSEVRLRSRLRTEESTGGYRTRHPRETWNRYEPLISPLTGVVRHVREVALPETDLVHIYTASHALAATVGSLKAVRRDVRDHSGGKGRTDLDARVSALCESLERFSSVHGGSERVVVGRASEMGEPTILPNTLTHFSTTQFEGRVEWNADRAGDFQWVPEPYRDERIEWCPMRSLLTDEEVFVPASHVFFGFVGEGRRFCRGDSNGLAAGNCLEEAVVQGFMELVERDAVALWWYNRAERPGVDLLSFDDPYLAAVKDFYESHDRAIWLLDLTTDLRIPSFAALAAGAEDGSDVIFGFGSHLDPRIAVNRAVTELNQMLPTVAQPMESRRRQLLPDFRDAIEWWEEIRVHEHEYLLPASTSAVDHRADAYGTGSGDLLEVVRTCTECVEELGSDLLIYDLTRPDVGLSVVKVIVPVLRHFWRRLGPGRLYEVPLRLGWLEQPVAESEMNPIAMFV